MKFIRYMFTILYRTRKYSGKIFNNFKFCPVPWKYPFSMQDYAGRIKMKFTPIANTRNDFAKRKNLNKTNKKNI